MKSSISIPDVNSRHTANAFLVGIIFNQTIRSEDAFQAPLKLFERLRTDDCEEISKLEYDKVHQCIISPVSLHPFAKNMTYYICSGMKLLTTKYDSDARNIWSQGITTQELLSRFEQFAGIGRHKALVACAMLRYEFGIEIIDNETQIDISQVCPRLEAYYSLTGLMREQRLLYIKQSVRITF